MISLLHLRFHCMSREEEIDRVYEKLAQDGTVFMPLAAYPFSEKFGWVGDRFGVTWQLTLAKN